jgi:hypothetical protein
MNPSVNYIPHAVTSINYAFCTDGVFLPTILTINSDYFPKYYQMISFCSAEEFTLFTVETEDLYIT